MRICIVSTFFPPHVGGLEVVVQQQAKSLAADGHQVVVVTGLHDRDLPTHEIVDGYAIHRIAILNTLEEHTGIPYPVAGLSAMRRLWRQLGQCDVIHIHDVLYEPCLLSAAIGICRRKRLFVTQHVAIVAHSVAVVEWIQWLGYRLLGRLVWSAAERVITYNPLVSNFLRKHGVPAQKILQVFNGVDTSSFRPGSLIERRSIRARWGMDPDRPVVLFVGRLVPKKGLTQILGAIDPTYDIVCVGPGVRLPEIPAGVTLLGARSRGELAELYRAADLFVFPALGEMMTLVMQEAMASGLPVITTNDPHYRDYDLDPRLVLLVARASADVRAAILRVLGDAPLREEMSAYSRRYAESKLSWDANHKLIRDLYRA